MSQLRGTKLVLDVVQAGSNVISGQGATRTLNANESGSTVLLDRAAGIVVTLPVAKVGVYYDFVATASVTSNAYKIITGAGTELLIGGYTSVDTDTGNAVAFFSPNGSTHIAVSSNGTTTGGLLGTKLRFTCLSSTKWLVEGSVQGSGTVATAFSAS